jgi:predicted DNA-binding transcriptional regulator AlpA
MPVPVSRYGIAMAPDPRTFTLTEAAEVTGVSRVTVRRWLDAGRFPSAFQRPPVGGAPGAWLIPAPDLTAAGLSLEGAARPRPKRAGGAGAAERPDLAERLAVAEALAEERLRTITSLEQQLSDMRAILASTLFDRARGTD